MAGEPRQTYLNRSGETFVAGAELRDTDLLVIREHFKEVFVPISNPRPFRKDTGRVVVSLAKRGDWTFGENEPVQIA